METLQEYDVTIEYWKGEANVVADALSRLPMDRQELRIHSLQLLKTHGLSVRRTEGSEGIAAGILQQLRIYYSKGHRCPSGGAGLDSFGFRGGWWTAWPPSPCPRQSKQ